MNLSAEEVGVLLEEVEVQTSALEALASRTPVPRAAVCDARIRSARVVNRGKRRRVMFGDDADLFADPVVAAQHHTQWHALRACTGVCPPLGPEGPRSADVAVGVHHSMASRPNTATERAMKSLTAHLFPRVAVAYAAAEGALRWADETAARTRLSAMIASEAAVLGAQRQRFRQKRGAGFIGQGSTLSKRMMAFLGLTMPPGVPCRAVEPPRGPPVIFVPRALRSTVPVSSTPHALTFDRVLTSTRQVPLARLPIEQTSSTLGGSLGLAVDAISGVYHGAVREKNRAGIVIIAPLHFGTQTAAVMWKKTTILFRILFVESKEIRLFCCHLT